MPICPPLTAANASTLRLSYTNDSGLTGIDEVSIHVALAPSDCVN